MKPVLPSLSSPMTTPNSAQTEADRLSDMLWDVRGQLTLDLPDAAQAVEQAIQSESPPVVLVEMGDNIGGGSPGDSTFILAELVRQEASGVRRGRL